MDKDAIAFCSLFPSFKYTGTSCLETERKDVGSDIGACFINDANDAKWNRYFFDNHSIMTFCFGDSFIQWRGELCYISQITGHCLYARWHTASQSASFTLRSSSTSCTKTAVREAWALGAELSRYAVMLPFSASATEHSAVDVSINTILLMITI